MWYAPEIETSARTGSYSGISPSLPRDHAARMTHNGHDLLRVDRHLGLGDQELNEYLIARDLVLPQAALRNGDVQRKRRKLRSLAPKGRTRTHMV
jgi:hypothetical protein